MEITLPTERIVINLNKSEVLKLLPVSAAAVPLESCRLLAKWIYSITIRHRKAAIAKAAMGL